MYLGPNGPLLGSRTLPEYWGYTQGARQREDLSYAPILGADRELYDERTTTTDDDDDGRTTTTTTTDGRRLGTGGQRLGTGGQRLGQPSRRYLSAGSRARGPPQRPRLGATLDTPTQA